MGYPKLEHRLSIISATALALSGCGQNALRPPLGLGGATATVPVASSPGASSAVSWMAPEVASEDLIYVTNVQNVKVFSYRTGKHVGTLKGFFRAQGACADTVGHVFIANQDTIVEYKHGGKKPIRTITFAGYSSVSCGTDPITGNLAVTWSGGSDGYVAVYQGASGTPALYSYNNLTPYYCGYDDKGDLFVDGTPGETNGFVFAELPKGGDSLVDVSLNQRIGFPGLVQRDRKYIAVEDLDTYIIYRFAISDFTGTVKGTTSLEGLNISGQGSIVGDRIVVPNGAFINYQPIGQILYFNYPKGGTAIKTITDGDDTAPFAVTVSRAPH